MFAKTALLSTILVAPSALGLGINCRGSFRASNSGALSDSINKLKGTDLGQTYGDGQQIVCAQQGDDAKYNQGTCVFYQNVGGRTFSGQQTLDFLYKLGDHGCANSGSVPTDDGNDVANGELTLNFVDTATPAHRRSLSGSIPPATRVNKEARDLAARSLGLTKRLGINCRGAGDCTVNLPGAFAGDEPSIDDIYNKVNVLSGGDWGEGQQIARVPFGAGYLAAFYQNVGDRRFDKDTTVGLIQGLKDHQCGRCGSIPTDPGNNIDNGELTINYVLN